MNTKIFLGLCLLLITAAYADGGYVKVTRHLSDGVGLGNKTHVNFDIQTEGIAHAGIQEGFPGELNVSNISCGGIINRWTGNMEFLFWEQGIPLQNMSCGYDIQIPEEARGLYFFQGREYDENGFHDIDGDQVLRINQDPRLDDVVRVITAWVNGNVSLQYALEYVTAYYASP